MKGGPATTANKSVAGAKTAFLPSAAALAPPSLQSRASPVFFAYPPNGALVWPRALARLKPGRILQFWDITGAKPCRISQSTTCGCLRLAPPKKKH
jgi:hypothetical protein